MTSVGPRKETAGAIPAAPVRIDILVLLSVLAGVVLAGLDSAIVNIALPSLSEALNASPGHTVWVVDAFQLATAVCLLPAAALGEILSLRRVYLFGLAVFGLASFACAMATRIDVLIAARAAQGVGGACMAALAPALVRGLYPRAQVARGLAMVALSVALSGSLGPTVGALILSVAAWPWLFYVNLPICVAAFVIFTKRADFSERRPRRFDVFGAVGAALALGAIVVGIDMLGGAQAPLAWGLLAGGLVLGAALLRQQRRMAHPLIPVDLMAIPMIRWSMMASTCSYATQILAYVSLPFLFETELGRSPFASGLLMTSWPVLVMVAAPVAGRLAGRIRLTVLGLAGLAALALGMVLLATMPHPPGIFGLIWRMAICGVGFGFYQTPNNTAMMTSGPPERSGAAGGALAVARVFGWCLGAALAALIFTAHGTAADCLTAGAVTSLLGLAVGLRRLRLG